MLLTRRRLSSSAAVSTDAAWTTRGDAVAASNCSTRGVAEALRLGRCVADEATVEGVVCFLGAIVLLVLLMRARAVARALVLWLLMQCVRSLLASFPHTFPVALCPDASHLGNYPLRTSESHSNQLGMG